MTRESQESTQPQRCPQCGSRLAFTTSQHLPCLVCLMKLGLETSDDSASGEPADTKTRSHGFDAPDIEQLQPHFPQFEFVRLLGQGGMGAVYEAKQTTLDRTVAVKIIHPVAAADQNFAERFQREARSLAKLSHPNIVTVHDFGEVNVTGNDGSAKKLFFIVMEHVDGANLRELMRTKELTPAGTLRIVPAICDALQYAHDSGIVHRDIKPENILVDRTGRVKIADFGLVKLIGREQKDRTLTGEYQAMGTMHYMAPEQFERPLEVDHRADIYALGVTLYELLTGELPLGRFLPPSQRVQVDVRLDEIVLKSMDREPGRRYQHASDVKTDVEHVSATTATSSAQDAKPRIAPQPFAGEIDPIVPRTVALILGGTLLLMVMKFGVLKDARTWIPLYPILSIVLVGLVARIRRQPVEQEQVILGSMLTAALVCLLTMPWLVEHLHVPLNLGEPGNDEPTFLRVGLGIFITWMFVELVSLRETSQTSTGFEQTMTTHSPFNRWVAAVWLGLPDFFRLVGHLILSVGILFCLIRFLGFHLDPTGGEVHFRFGGPEPWMTIDMTPTGGSIQWHSTVSALMVLAAYGLFRLDSWLASLEGKSYPSELWLGFGIGLFYFWFIGICSTGLGNNATFAPEGSPLSRLLLGAQGMARLISGIGFLIMIGSLVWISWDARQKAIAQNGKANSQRLFHSREGLIAIGIAVVSSLAIIAFVIVNMLATPAVKRAQADRETMLLGDWTETNDTDRRPVRTLRFLESGEFQATGRMANSLEDSHKVAVANDVDGDGVEDVVPVRFTGWWKLKGEQLVTQFTSSTVHAFNEESPGGRREFEIKELTPQNLSLATIDDDKKEMERWTFFRPAKRQSD